MKSIAAFLARWIVRRPALVLALGALLALTAFGVLSLRQNFDTDILNLLPADQPAVRGLQTYNKEFTQTRELAFLLTWDQPPEDIAEYRARFAALLRQQPWVLRMLDEAPVEDSDGADETREVVVPLLMNLTPERFSEALQLLSPGQAEPRLQRLAAQITAGSPRAAFELKNDPLGLAGLAARPVWETVSLSDAFDLVSPDQSAVIVPVITNQTDPSTEACHDLMAKVHAFIASARQELGPGAPKIQVTGNAAYVDEISTSMQRDIAITSTVSLLAVAALFWVGFRRFLPLLGITLILALSALVAMAFGVVIFSQLNIIAISFCAILFGLGDDFSLLLCQHFFQAQADGQSREQAIASSISHCLPGMFWVALTTGVGFLALCFGGSAGFAQLGLLVAMGVFLCATLMPIFLFPFVHEAPPSGVEFGPAVWLAERCRRQPRSLLIFSGLLILVSLGLLFSPLGRLGYDLSPSSLEPKNTPAAQTLATMLQKFPATFEPIMVVLPHPNAGQLRELDEALNALKKDGLIESFSSPSGLRLDPDRSSANRATLRQANLPELRGGMEQTWTKVGLRPDPAALGMIDSLQKETQQEAAPAWKDYLSPASRWWFLIDRMVSPSSDALIAYLRPAKSLSTEDRLKLSARIEQAAPEAMVTGWSQMLVTLVAWAENELFVFGSAVAVIVLILLGVVYRDSRLWLLHSVSMAGALIATAATLKVLEIPINLLNVLAFPLLLAVGVDYGTHLILSAREGATHLSGTLKAVGLSGLTTATGFGALGLAQNPALAGLGAICGIGVFWCLAFSLFMVTPGAMLATRLASLRGKE